MFFCKIHTVSGIISCVKFHCRFKKKGKKWYNWSDAEAQKQWDDAAKDPNVPRCKDAFGNLCLAKLEDRVLAQGVNVSTNRHVAESSQHGIDNDPQELQAIKDSSGLSLQNHVRKHSRIILILVSLRLRHAQV